MYLTVWVELEITTQLLNGENAMKITKWDEQAAEDIGHAFGYYDYGQETGMGVFYSSKEAVANYIAGYVRMAFEGQLEELIVEIVIGLFLLFTSYQIGIIEYCPCYNLIVFQNK